MSKILFLTNVLREMGMMQKTLGKLQRETAFSPESACGWITENTEWNEHWQEQLQHTGLLFIKWMGTGLDTPFLKECLHYAQRQGMAYYLRCDDSDEGCYVGGLTAAQRDNIQKYLRFADEHNFYNLWRYLEAVLQGGEEAIPPANPLLWCGIFHPRSEKIYTDLESYKRDFWQAGRPTVGIFFYRDEWVWGDLQYQAALVTALEKQGMNVICVFTNGMPIAELGMPGIPQVVQQYFCEQGLPIIDVLLNTMKFSLTGSGALTLDYLRQWNIPVLEPYTLMASYEDWNNSFEGMNAMEVSISISLPEFDGIIHGVPVATKKHLDNGEVRYQPMEERIERMASKALKWANLRRKANAEKKIAIIFHNYPPRNSNIGSALGLDSIESIRRVLAAMRERGYRVGTIPADTKEFIQELTANATNERSMLTDRQIAEAQKITGAEYAEFFGGMEAATQEHLTRDWGAAPGTVMEYDGSLLVPGTMNGNIFVTVQPPRGFGENPEKIYHDPFCAPTHQYLAFYRWLRDVWQADAVAHIGTHGSLEWLPGKNAGLSRACYPDLAIGDLPNIYPYNICITGEGVQATRRGAACLIEQLPAPQAQAGVYDELEELEKMMDEYVHFAASQPENAQRLQELVLEKVAEANLQEEVPYEAGKPFREYIMALHNYITDLKNMEVHTGLHILGQPPEGEQLIDYLWLLLRLDNGSVPSLTQAIAATYGFDYYELLQNSSLIYAPLNITYAALIDRIYAQCRELIGLLAEQGFQPDAWAAVQQLPWLAAAPAELRGKLEQVCRYICTQVYPHLQLTTQEIENMLRGFEGQYVEPGPSGAPASGGADRLPTGRNFYGIDPRTLPTPAAWEIGKTLANQVIERFIAEEGHYPENIGIVLWSGSNMRSHGQCVAEFLYLLGIRPHYQSGSLHVTGLEVIPLAELGRPRIDVTARISGLFRDSMPSVMELLDRAVLLAAEQEEEPEANFVRKHIQGDSRELTEQAGLTAEDAWRQAAYRIFGDQAGTYGAGVPELLEAKNWETIDDIADVYVRWGAHAYGGKAHGEFLPQQFRRRMGSLDITIKNEDNHEVNMLGSDDYNAYHGGMIAAVRSIKGSAPHSYCGDSTDRTRVAMHSLQEETKRLFRSEAINPKFIEGMMKHGYKGAADLANMVAHSDQWDAASAVLADWMYEKYAEKYAFDPKVQEWLRDVNPWALQRLAEVLLEAEQRGLWNARPETKAELQKLYLEMEGELEDRADVQ